MNDKQPRSGVGERGMPQTAAQGKSEKREAVLMAHRQRAPGTCAVRARRLTSGKGREMRKTGSAGYVAAVIVGVCCGAVKADEAAPVAKL